MIKEKMAPVQSSPECGILKKASPASPELNYINISLHPADEESLRKHNLSQKVINSDIKVVNHAARHIQNQLNYWCLESIAEHFRKTLAPVIKICKIEPFVKSYSELKDSPFQQEAKFFLEVKNWLFSREPIITIKFVILKDIFSFLLLYISSQEKRSLYTIDLSVRESSVLQCERSGGEDPSICKTRNMQCFDDPAGDPFFFPEFDDFYAPNDVWMMYSPPENKIPGKIFSFIMKQWPLFQSYFDQKKEFFSIEEYHGRWTKTIMTPIIEILKTMGRTWHPESTEDINLVEISFGLGQGYIYKEFQHSHHPFCSVEQRIKHNDFGLFNARWLNIEDLNNFLKRVDQLSEKPFQDKWKEYFRSRIEKEEKIKNSSAKLSEVSLFSMTNSDTSTKKICQTSMTFT